MAIDKKLIDQLLTDYKKPEDIIGENGLLKELTKAILEFSLASRADRPSWLREARPGRPAPGQHAQREKPKDFAGRLRGAGVGDSARPPSHIRSQDRGQEADPAGWPTFYHGVPHPEAAPPLRFLQGWELWQCVGWGTLEFPRLAGDTAWRETRGRDVPHSWAGSALFLVQFFPSESDRFSHEPFRYPEFRFAAIPLLTTRSRAIIISEQ